MPQTVAVERLQRPNEVRVDTLAVARELEPSAAGRLEAAEDRGIGIGDYVPLLRRGWEILSASDVFRSSETTHPKTGLPLLPSKPVKPQLLSGKADGRGDGAGEEGAGGLGHVDFLEGEVVAEEEEEEEEEA